MQKSSVIIILVVSMSLQSQGLKISDLVQKSRNEEVTEAKLPQPQKNDNVKIVNPEELKSSYWIDAAQKKLSDQLRKKINTNVAKNVIYFMGDGMSLATITAARIYSAQKLNKSGEENFLSFEEFPHVGLSKPWCVDKQTGDSACTATAYLTGVKGNYMTIGVNAKVGFNDCEAMLDESNHVDSIIKWAQDAGKLTGIVTTTRITHASPAGAYAHIANRDWECDANIKKFPEAKKCIGHDIATQLIRNSPGKNLNVIYGGGRKKFISKSVIDEKGIQGERTDNLNLINEWIENKKSTKSSYITDREGLLRLNTSVTENVLGLFSSNHMDYHLSGNKNQPTLREMTKSAIEILRKGEKGFVLFVEGGRIDHGHHDNMAHHALEETEEFDKAISTAMEMTNEEETLIVVTSDHSHTMTMSGYSKRGVDILGFNSEKSMDNSNYLTLSYANGPSGNRGRKEIDAEEMKNYDFQFSSLIPLESETHGGEDVPIYSRGPYAHILTGTMEQNVIPHLISYAACIGNGLTVCSQHNSKVISVIKTTEVI